jgi:hypothetical protein
MFAALRWPASSTYIQENNEMNITESLEVLLRQAVEDRINAVKLATEQAIQQALASVEQIRAAAGRVVAELEAHAERIASGQAVAPQAHSTAPPVSPQTPSVATQVHSQAAAQVINSTDPDAPNYTPPTHINGLVQARTIPYRG